MFTRKKPVLVSFLIKLQAFRFQLCLRETPTQVFTRKYCKTFKNTYFEERLLLDQINPSKSVFVQFCFCFYGNISVEHMPKVVWKYLPLVPCVHSKVTLTWTNLQLQCAGLFKYVWPFSGHQALKVWRHLLRHDLHQQLT